MGIDLLDRFIGPFLNRRNYVVVLDERLLWFRVNETAKKRILVAYYRA